MRARAILAAVLVGAAALASCGPPARDPQTIEFWTLQLSPTFDDYLTALVDSFETAHPGVTVKWVDVPYEGITQKFLASIASGRSPDVVNLPADYVQNYVALDALVPLDSLLADSVKAGYLPAATDPLRSGGRTYGVPWYLSTQVLLYDRAKLARAGFAPDGVPTTFPELLAFARTYHERTGQYAFFTPLVADGFLFELFRTEGVPMVSPDGRRAVFHTPRAVAVLTPWVEAFQAGVMPRESLSQPQRTALRLYQSGTIAMFVGGPQFLKLIAENAPSIAATTDVAPAFTGSTGKRGLAVMALAVSTRTANAALAAEFAAFVTSAENQLAFARTVPIYPSVTRALRDPYFTAGDSTVEARARVLGASLMDDAVVLKPSLRSMSRLQESFKGHLLKAFLGSATPDEALAAAQADWNQILAEQW